MPETLERWTAARVRELPDDGNRYEVVDGELLVTPAPSWKHQDVVGEQFVMLRAYCRSLDLGHAVFSPADIELDPATLVQPDVFVVPPHEGQQPRRWQDIRKLLLVVEVLSASTARADRTVKRKRFQQAGVPEYWIVDVDARLVERWRPGDDRPEIVTEQLTWHPKRSEAPLLLDLPEFFNSVRHD